MTKWICACVVSILVACGGCIVEVQQVPPAPDLAQQIADLLGEIIARI
jgi:hypothetical protein